MMMEKKSNIFIFSISLLIVIITSTILGVCGLLWWYYPLGAILGGVTHILMLVQSKRFFRIQNNEFEKALFHPKKDAFLWYGLRILVVIIGLGLLFLMACLNHRDHYLEISLMVIGGILTIKVVFIVFLLIKKEGR